MDWRAGHLTTTEGTGDGAFANKNCPQGWAFEQFFQMPGVFPGVCPGGMLAAGTDSHISFVAKRTQGYGKNQLFMHFLYLLYDIMHAKF